MIAPDPWPNGTHLVVRGRIVVVIEHAPCSDAWNYRGTPADLAGDIVTFAHSEATPVTRPITPRPVGSVLPDVARDLIARAKLDLAVFDEEVEEAESPLAELLRAVDAVIHSGAHRIPDLRGAYIRFQES